MGRELERLSEEPKAVRRLMSPKLKNSTASVLLHCTLHTAHCTLTLWAVVHGNWWNPEAWVRNNVSNERARGGGVALAAWPLLWPVEHRLHGKGDVERRERLSVRGVASDRTGRIPAREQGLGSAL